MRDLLDAIMHTSVAAITVLDTAGRFVFVNGQAEQILGLPRDQLLDRMYDAAEWRATAIDGGPWTEDIQPFTRVMRTGQPVFDLRHALEWPNGRRKLLSINGAPIRDDQGQIVNLVFSFTDITERIRTEQILRRIVESTAATGQAFFAAMVRALAESLEVRCAFVGELCEPNRDRVRTLAVWTDGAPAPNFDYALANTPCAAIAEAQPCLYRDGVSRRFPEDAMLRELAIEGYLGVPLTSSAGKVIGLMVVLSSAPIDDSLEPGAVLQIFAGKVAAEIERARAEAEREALRAQLLQAQKLESVGRLAGGVAHDFNTLLTAILCYAELGERLAAGDDRMQGYLRQITEAAGRGARLTEQLLAFARKQVLEPRVIDLNALVAGALDMLRRLIGSDVELAWTPGPSPLRVKVDPGQIEQILMNFVVNARDAMPAGGRLTIETGGVTLAEASAGLPAEVAPGEYVMLAVTDTGTGIPPEVLPMIFEPFFTTKEPSRGTGLGLATCYGIVKQHRAHIAVESEPGQGATFRVYLPRADGH